MHLYTQNQWPQLPCFGIKISKLIEQFLRKWPKSKFQAELGLSGLRNGALQWFNGIHLYTQHLWPQLPCFGKKISKLIEQFLSKWPKSGFWAYLCLSCLKWNKLAKYLDSIKCMSQLKRQLKRHFLSSYPNNVKCFYNNCRDCHPING